jgi:hypothetical protein
MSKKTILIDQPFYVGDIIFSMAIAQDFANRGFDVLYPIMYDEDFIDDLRFRFPTINFIQSTKFKDFEKYHKTNIVDEKYIVIPLIKSWFGPPVPERMANKYLSIGWEIKEWRNVKIKRNYNKELELFNLLGIKPGDEYDLFNLNYHLYPTIYNTEKETFSIKEIQIDDNIKQIKMSIIDGFSIFDWIGVLERAKNIHTVHTAVHYLMDLYCDSDVQELHIYDRGSHDLHSIKNLFTKRYFYHD